MSLIKSIKGNDQLLLDGFRYRRDRLVWHCVKASCKGRARPDGNTFNMYKDHICQAPDPNEIKKKAAQCHDSLTLINFARKSRAPKCHARKSRAQVGVGSSVGGQMSRAQTSWNQ